MQKQSLLMSLRSKKELEFHEPLRKQKKKRDEFGLNEQDIYNSNEVIEIDLENKLFKWSS